MKTRVISAFPPTSTSTVTQRKEKTDRLLFSYSRFLPLQQLTQ